MALLKETKDEVIGNFRMHGTDTGSAEVQVALLTERIKQITQHLVANKKDVASRRGLQIMVGRRRRLLKYISRNDLAKYQALIARLGLRR
jgi:small subunit ribosomal protein S15